MKWAHKALDQRYRSKEVEFNDLTLVQYVMRENRIIGLTDNETERDCHNRLMHKLAVGLDESRTGQHVVRHMQLKGWQLKWMRRIGILVLAGLTT